MFAPSPFPLLVMTPPLCSRKAVPPTKVRLKTKPVYVRPGLLEYHRHHSTISDFGISDIVIENPVFAGTAQMHDNRAADQRLCFYYTDRANSLLYKSGISNL